MSKKPQLTLYDIEKPLSHTLVILILIITTDAPKRPEEVRCSAQSVS